MPVQVSLKLAFTEQNCVTNIFRITVYCAGAAGAAGAGAGAGAAG